MRRIVAFLLAGTVLAAVPASAQGMEQYLELLRQDMRAEKVAVVTDAMMLSDAESEKFWPIYREYDFSRTELGDKQLQLVKDYAAAFDTMTDETAKDILKRAQKIDDEETKLQKKAIKDMEKALGSVVAARFFQVDNQIRNLISLQIAANMPLVQKGTAAPAAADPHAGHNH